MISLMKVRQRAVWSGQTMQELMDRTLHITRRFGDRAMFATPDNMPIRLNVREAAIREALGRWVSELEPSLLFNHQGRFVGLVLAGRPLGTVPDVTVPIKGGVPI